MIESDAVDKILAQWQRERPDLDVSPMGIIGRMGRLAKHLERAIQETFSEFSLTVGEFDVFLIAYFLRLVSIRSITIDRLVNLESIRPIPYGNNIDYTYYFTRYSRLRRYIFTEISIV